MLGLWLLKLHQPRSFPPRKAFLDPQFGSSLCPLQKGFFASQIFLEYLRDPLRSGKYNINPAIYARITCRVLEILNTNPPCFGNPIFLNTFEEWMSCLTQSAPTSELLSALRLKPANAWVTYLLTKGNNFQVVLNWLEKIDPPPLDMIQHWRDRKRSPTTSAGCRKEARLSLCMRPNDHVSMVRRFYKPQGLRDNNRRPTVAEPKSMVRYEIGEGLNRYSGTWLS